jgi:hypothetical protein
VRPPLKRSDDELLQRAVASLPDPNRLGPRLPQIPEHPPVICRSGVRGCGKRIAAIVKTPQGPFSSAGPSTLTRCTSGTNCSEGDMLGPALRSGLTLTARGTPPTQRTPSGRSLAW